MFQQFADDPFTVKKISSISDIEILPDAVAALLIT